MKIEDAAKILEIDGNLDKDIIKMAYRRAAKKFHPDMGGSDEMMKAVNEAYETLKSFEGCVESGNEEGENFAEDLNDAINAVINVHGVIVEVCGSWVTGNTKPNKDVLKGANFKWARKKSDMSAWFFRPSDYKSKNRGKWSMDKIRDQHGSNIIQKKEGKKIESAA